MTKWLSLTVKQKTPSFRRVRRIGSWFCPVVISLPPTNTLFICRTVSSFWLWTYTSSSSRALKLTVAFLCNTLRHLGVSDDTAGNFRTEELFSARDNKPSNLMAAHWCRARVNKTRGNSTDRIVGRKTDQRKIYIFVNTFSHFAISSFKHAPFILLP